MIYVNVLGISFFVNRLFPVGFTRYALTLHRPKLAYIALPLKT